MIASNLLHSWCAAGPWVSSGGDVTQWWWTAKNMNGPKEIGLEA